MNDQEYIAALNRDLMVERARAEDTQARVAELEAELAAAKDDANKCHAWGRQITDDWVADRERLEAEVEKERTSKLAWRDAAWSSEAEVEKLRERGDRWKASARERVRRAQQAEAERDNLAEALRKIVVTDDDLPTCISIARAALEGKAE